MEKTCKLTISILASNRKDTLPKCLESIKPLLEKVSSELIVTDTGCDEDLLDVIRKYTDKVVKFTWCNDFAKARNVGLSMAKGQWFMFIDDDEWFENVDELINFFNGEEEKKYNFGRYIVRNYTNMNGDSWSEGVVARVFRIEEGAKFVGKIHEYISMGDVVTKQFTSYAHHYGYVFENDEKMQEHSERNTSLLISEIEDNPADARNYAHLYQEFRLRKDYEKAWEYTEKAIENVDGSKRENQKAMCSTYVNGVCALTSLEKFEQAIDFGNELLDNKPLSMLARAAIISYMCMAYVKIGNYAKCMELADEYLKIKLFYIEKRDSYYADLAPLLYDTYQESGMGRVLSSALKSAIEEEDARKAFKYVLSFDWSKEVYMVEPECIGRLADMVAKDGNSRDAVRAFGKVFTHVIYSNILLKRIKELKDENADGYMTVCSVMSNVAGQYGYGQMVNIIATNRENDIQKLNQLYGEFVKAGNNLLLMENEFFEIAVEKGVSLGDIITKGIREADWTDMIQQWLSDVTKREIIEKSAYIQRILPDENRHKKIFEKFVKSYKV